MKRGDLRQTHTFATLEVAASTYDDVRERIVALGPEYIREYIHEFEQGAEERIVLGAVGLARLSEPPLVGPEATREIGNCASLLTWASWLETVSPKARGEIDHISERLMRLVSRTGKAEKQPNDLHEKMQRMRDSCWVVIPERAEFPDDDVNRMCFFCETGKTIGHDVSCPFA